MTDRRGVFALPPGADFPGQLVAGLRARMATAPPEAMAAVTVYLNTQRMRRMVQQAFAETGAGFLPRLALVTDLEDAGLPPAIPPLRRRLELTQLVARLLERQPDLAPRAALYPLSDSLATLLDEMQDEAVSPAALAALDVQGHAAHWQRTQAFLGIVAPVFAAGGDAGARRRLAVARLAARWQAAPPAAPVIVAGSTGSRGTTTLLMQAVLDLPAGMVVLPGFDFDLPGSVWRGMDDALTAEDHPQFRHLRLCDLLGADPAAMRLWAAAPPPDAARNRLISLSLRPAPVTDQWLTEGQRLGDLRPATAAVTLIEAASPRAEAVAIALILRRAAEDGRSAALISPDRGLTRQVTAALDRWGIRPDDSAGLPLDLSAPGRFLRHLAALCGARLTAEALLVLLKHPLTATGGAGRGDHLRLSRDLELHLRRHGPAFPGPDFLRQWGAAQRGPAGAGWGDWLAGAVTGLADIGTQPLTDHVAHHLALAETLAGGPGAAGAGALWLEPAGVAALAAMTGLAREAPHGGALSPQDYTALCAAILAQGEVREAVQGHPLIRILGPREARECRSGLVILGGMNDGTWPRRPGPDPWLNRQMRQAAGLLLPERQVGLAAHDYQQAVAAPEVVLTRALRDAEAETVASRWLNRLQNLMAGLPDQHGPAALAAMRDRGQVWLDMGAALDLAAPAARAPRPAPRPPVAARPVQLAVTGIARLIRDPYAIYARHVLGLYRLNALRQDPDALARGSVLHDILERFIADRGPETRAAAHARLLRVADAVLAEQAPWPAARALWRARLDRAAAGFLAREAAMDGAPVLLEKEGRIDLPALGFTLTARPDRIDALPDGRLHILDYKSGTPPTQKQQAQFDKQLLLEAAMAERGGFADLGPRDVARITYVGLGSGNKVESQEITAEILARAWDSLHRLIGRYMTRAQGYTARRAVFEDRFEGDYDHLARHGEWDMTDPAAPEDVG